jgi:hypothetical protein
VITARVNRAHSIIGVTGLITGIFLFKSRRLLGIAMVTAGAVVLAPGLLPRKVTARACYWDCIALDLDKLSAKTTPTQTEANAPVSPRVAERIAESEAVWARAHARGPIRGHTERH